MLGTMIRYRPDQTTCPQPIRRLIPARQIQQYNHIYMRAYKLSAREYAARRRPSFTRRRANAPMAAGSRPASAAASGPCTATSCSKRSSAETTCDCAARASGSWGSRGAACRKAAFEGAGRDLLSPRLTSVAARLPRRERSLFTAPRFDRAGVARRRSGGRMWSNRAMDYRPCSADAQRPPDACGSTLPLAAGQRVRPLTPPYRGPTGCSGSWRRPGPGRGRWSPRRR